MPQIVTLGRNPSFFDYEGSVGAGTKLLFAGKPFITSELYQVALKHFSGQVVPAGVSMTDPTPGGFGDWLQNNSSKYGRTLTPRHGSFLAAILSHEGYIESSIRRNAILLHFPVHKERRHTRVIDMDFVQQIEPSATLNDVEMLKSEKILLSEIVDFEKRRQKTRQEMESRGFNEGFFTTVVFVGENKLGQTRAAEVLSYELNLQLFRIDLSMLVSKYIGETEKNLRKVFDAAENGGAILFFDEADTLFGKRSEVKGSHDRYANIEITYLLQRIESHQGVVILATNRKDSLEPAFTQRIRFIVNFPCVEQESDEEWEMKIDELQQRNGIWFHNRMLIREAMTHSTYVNEHLDEGLRDNLRLAHLGDAICDLIVSDYLLHRYTEKEVGSITDLRKKLVEKGTLAVIAKNIGLGEVLRLGKGEEMKKGRTNSKNLCTAIEAFVGSLYLDQGLERVNSFLIPRLATFLENS